jgi:hypothetical protein
MGLVDANDCGRGHRGAGHGAATQAKETRADAPNALLDTAAAAEAENWKPEAVSAE